LCKYPLGYARAGSNPAAVVRFLFWCFFQPEPTVLYRYSTGNINFVVLVQLRAGSDATATAAAASALRAKLPVPVGNVQAAVSAAKDAGWIRTYGSSGAGAGAGQRGAVPGPAHGGSLRLPLRTKTHAGRSVNFLLKISKLV
jgi:hypothetical protein